MEDDQNSRRERKNRKTLLEFEIHSPASELDAPQPVVRVIGYGPEQFFRTEITDLSVLPKFIGAFPMIWIDVDSLGDSKVVEAIGKTFGLHELALEDVLNVHQRAKVEDYGDNLFVVTHMIFDAVNPATEQLSMFVGKNFVVTFQESPGDCLDPVRERIAKSKGQIRSLGSDYLMYCIIDASIDSYFPALEHLGESLEELEDEIVGNPKSDSIKRIHEAKRILLGLRRSVWPMRDALNALLRDQQGLISAHTLLYLRDCYDHSVRVLEFLETYREVCSDMMDAYLSSASNRLNEVMKVLTIITTLFVPPTFIVGVYGMNFHGSPYNMPELSAYYGYPVVWAVILLVMGCMLSLLYWHGWIGHREGHKPGDL
jgi:magnesium transporter